MSISADQCLLCPFLRGFLFRVVRVFRGSLFLVAAERRAGSSAAHRLQKEPRIERG